MDTIRVLIVDDHPMVRRGLKSLLSSYPDIQVVGEAENGAAALEAVSARSPEIVLLDIELPGADGVKVARQLSHLAPSVKIIALTAYDNEEYVLNALGAGMFAYLLKRTSDETVVQAVRSVHQGKRLLSPALMDQVLRQFQSLARSQTRHASGLSDQDLRVLELIAQGFTNKEIARETHWSERTVKREIEQIVSRMGVRNRAQAVAEAIRRGLV
jgi:DNA-binding NarL/FixJ family response regulator